MVVSRSEDTVECQLDTVQTQNTITFTFRMDSERPDQPDDIVSHLVSRELVAPEEQQLVVEYVTSAIVWLRNHPEGPLPHSITGSQLQQRPSGTQLDEAEELDDKVTVLVILLSLICQVRAFIYKVSSVPT